MWVKEERKGFLEEIGEGGGGGSMYSDSWVGLGVVRGMFLVVWDLICVSNCGRYDVVGIDLSRYE